MSLEKEGVPFKVGITGRPEQRLHEYELYEPYDVMELIYRTRSSGYARALEHYLICSVWYECDNQSEGGEGRLTKVPPHYVYVVYNEIMAQ